MEAASKQMELEKKRSSSYEALIRAYSAFLQENYDEAALEIQTVYADLLSDNVKGIYNTVCNNVGVTGIEGTVDLGDSDESGEGDTDSEPDDSEGGSYDDEYSGDDSYDEYYEDYGYE